VGVSLLALPYLAFQALAGLVVVLVVLLLVAFQALLELELHLVRQELQVALVRHIPQ
tara:strand:- start:6 stop:176 length:171 start_codon:yes stop_codon:yes gene_type:complete